MAPPASEPDCLAHFLTFRTYGSWLPGDARGTVDRRQNAVGAEYCAPDRPLERWAGKQLRHPAIELSEPARAVVEAAVRQVCLYRGWQLRALNVRTNHLHAIVTAEASGERVMNDFKAYATRALREDGLVGRTQRVWAEHGSTRRLITDEALKDACVYVVEGQGSQLGSVGFQDHL